MTSWSTIGRVGLMVAGFDVPHAHLHVIPIHDFLDITPKVILDGGKVMAAEEELQRMRDALGSRLRHGAVSSR